MQLHFSRSKFMRNFSELNYDDFKILLDALHGKDIGNVEVLAGQDSCAITRNYEYNFPEHKKYKIYYYFGFDPQSNKYAAVYQFEDGRTVDISDKFNTFMRLLPNKTAEQQPQPEV